LHVTNTIAFLVRMSVTKKKGFRKLTLGPELQYFLQS
jgi:hypothetical protein